MNSGRGDMLMKRKRIRVVITGGPCAGKTAALERIRSAVDCPVLVVPETATELILQGITPWGNSDFQAIRVARQLQAEERASRIAEELPEKKILIVLDRGIADTRAYSTAETYEAILKQNGLTEADVMDRYDAVIHLTSAARGAAVHYTLLTNAARTETVREAAELDERILSAWASHDCRILIPAEEDFDQKMECLLRHIQRLLKV